MDGPELPRLPQPRRPASQAARCNRPPQSPSEAVVAFLAASRIPAIQPLGWSSSNNSPTSA